MDIKSSNLERLKFKKGIFGDRTVQGFQYREEAGTIAWHITTWPKRGDPIDDYWARDGEFFEVVGQHFLINARGDGLIQTGGRVTGIEASKLKSMQDAIRSWESEEEVLSSQ